MGIPNPIFDENTVSYEDFEAALRPKEMECLCLRCDGKSLKAIALALGISQFTVRNYMTSIYDKTGIRKPLILCQILQLAKKRTEWNNRVVIKGDHSVIDVDCDKSVTHRNIVVSTNRRAHRNVD